MTSKLTITDERLAELVAFKPLPGTDISSATRDEWMAMAAELQERRKAERDSEPVEWSNGCNKSVPAALRYLAENPRPIGGESSFNTAHLYQLAREIEFMAEAPLYRHAQQLVVPDRSIFEKWWESQNGAPLDGWDSLRTTDGYCDDGIDGQFEAWNAAMLAAAPQLPGSESATVPGKWIPVSERMPENDVSVLTFDGMYKRVHHAMYGHWQCWEPEKITHWMPLPAAPQEVKGE